MRPFLLELLKSADHAGDRFQERLPNVPAEVLERARQAASKIPAGPEDRMHLPLHHDGQQVGFAAYKRVGKSQKPVLATILGPDMQPNRSHLLDSSLLKVAYRIKAADIHSEMEEAGVDPKMSPAESARQRFETAAAGKQAPRQYDPENPTRLLRPESPVGASFGRSNEELGAYLKQLQEAGLPIGDASHKELDMHAAITNAQANNRAVLPTAFAQTHEMLNEPDHKAFRATKPEGPLQALIDKLPTTPPEERAPLLRSIMEEDKKLQSKIIGAAGKGLGKRLLNPMIGVPAVGLATANLWGGHALRAVQSRMHLSAEERQLPEEERDKLLAERSPTYRQFLQQHDTSSNITAKDMLAPVGVGMQLAQAKGMDRMFGGHVQSRLDTRETLARLVGAEQLFHGTTQGAGEKIRQSGIDPGYGGRPSGYTWKATQQQELAKILQENPQQFEALPEDLALKLRQAGQALGVPVDRPEVRHLDSGKKTPENWAQQAGKNLQPGITLPAYDAVTKSMPDGTSLDLDTSKFLDNAYGNIFLAKDQRAARQYALQQNPHITKGDIDKVTAGAEAVLKPLAQVGEKGSNWDRLRAVLGDSDARKGMTGMLGAGYRLQTGGTEMPTDKPALFATAMPTEKVRKMFEVDEDDVNQAGAAIRLKREHRTTPYVPGQEPAPGQKPNHFHIAPEDLNVNQNTYGSILKARTGDMAGYIRGTGLPESDRMLGMNKRFLSGVGRAGLAAGVYGGAAYSALAPVAKKLYRKYKEHQGEGETKESMSRDTSSAGPEHLPEAQVRDFLARVRDEAKEKKLHIFAVADNPLGGASITVGSSPAIVNARKAHVRWERGTGHDPNHDWSKAAMSNNSLAKLAADLSSGTAQGPGNSILDQVPPNVRAHVDGPELENYLQERLNKKTKISRGRLAAGVGVAGAGLLALAAFNNSKPKKDRLEQDKTAATKTRLYAGLRVRIDRPAGFVQKGKDKEGKPWERTYRCDYGYLAGTQGGDGDGLDVFLGPKEDGRAFLILQYDDKGAFDEFKLMLGFPNASAAREMYLAHVPAKYMGEMKEMAVGVLQGLTGRPVDHSKTAEAFLAGFAGALNNLA